MEALVIKDILVPVIAGLLLAAFTGAGAVAWWGIKRMVIGQDKIHDALTEIRDGLTENISSVRELKVREEYRDRADKQKHDDNLRQFENVWKAIGGLKRG